MAGASRPLDPVAREHRTAENADCLGGMRNPARAVARCPSWQTLGPSIRAWIHAHRHQLPQVDQMVTDLRAGRPIEAVPAIVADPLRHEFLEWLGYDKPSEEPLAMSMFKALGRQAGDYDLEHILPTWLSPSEGAPLGFDNDIPVCGVFPTVEPGTAPVDTASLVTTVQGWPNYVSVEDNIDVALDLVHKASVKGFCHLYDNFADLRKFVGSDDITLQKLALISKARADGTLKHRLVWDFLRSGTNGHIRLSERIVLPHIQDAARAAVKLLQRSLEGADLEWLVLDFADAFHHIWLQRRYWKLNCAKVEK